MITKTELFNGTCQKGDLKPNFSSAFMTYFCYFFWEKKLGKCLRRFGQLSRSFGVRKI